MSGPPIVYSPTAASAPSILVVPDGAGGTPGPAGAPGGNVLSIGLFSAASTVSVSTGTNTVRTSGYSSDGVGIADYVYDAAVNSAYVSANPRTSFMSSNGRGFRLVTVNEPNLAQFGATNGNDVTAAAQAAINYLGTAGGTIKVPAWVLYTTALVANAPVLFKADTFGDVTSNVNGSGITAARPIMYWNSASPGDMYTIKPASTGTLVYGGGSEGITWDGANVATRGVVFDNNVGGVWDGDARRCVTAGVDICCDSGTTSVYSQRVRIKRLHYVYGSAVATQGSHGLRIRGNGTTVPGTQHQLGEISGLVYNGNLVDIAETDNLHAWKIHGSVQSGGTGQAVRLRAGGAQAANNNLFEYVNGPYTADAGLHGNRINHYESEHGTINSGSVWHGDLLDYVTGRLYESHRFKLQKKLNIRSGDFIGDAASGLGDIASQWRTVTLVDTTTSSASAVIAPDMDLDAGTITGVEVFVAAAGTSAGNYRMRIRVSTEALDTTSRVVTPVVDDTSTYAAGANNQVHKLTLTFGTPMAFAKGNLLFLRVGRLGADALDTNTDALNLCGARLLYKSTGPNGSGSGTYTIPDWEA